MTFMRRIGGSLVSICTLLVLGLQTAQAQSFPTDFYTDGLKINGWLRFPDVGYDVSWHFARVDPNAAGWEQELAVKYYDRVGVFLYDAVQSKTFKGYYDHDKGKYFRLPPEYRRGHVEEIRPEWFEELKEMPFLWNLFRKSCEGVATSGPRLSEPPDPLPTPKEWLERKAKHALKHQPSNTADLSVILLRPVLRTTKVSRAE
jgi:hypothetical protein